MQTSGDDKEIKKMKSTKITLEAGGSEYSSYIVLRLTETEMDFLQSLAQALHEKDEKEHNNLHVYLYVEETKEP
jgi:hypothetical protein